MERAEQEAVARRARRVLWAFRTLLYGGAALAAVLLLTGSGGSPSLTELHGRTSEDEPLVFVLEDDRLEGVETYLAATCPDGSLQEVRWWAHAVHTARFELDEGTLRITDEVDRRYDDGYRGRRSFELRADFDGKSAHGTIRFAERISAPDGSSYVCEAEPVTFSAR